MLQLIGWPTASKATRLPAIADPAAPLCVSLLALASYDSVRRVRYRGFMQVLFMKQRILTDLISAPIVTGCRQDPSNIQTGMRTALAESLRPPIAGIMPGLAAMEDRA
jgi:hypothetical protein